MTSNDELLSIRAAELYYDGNKTQDQIGTILNLTRWKVGRLLADARANGFIRIEIVHPRARRVHLQRALCETYSLQDAVVVPSSGVTGEAELRSRTALAAADYLTALRPTPRSLGISWGSTLHDIAEHLTPGWASGVDVVQINGGVSLTASGGTAAATAVALARKANGTATLLPCPAIFEHRSTQASIVADRTVSAVLQRAASAGTYLFSAGVATAESALVTSGYLSTTESGVLVAQGAVGDVVGRFINAAGDIVDPDLDARTVGLTLDHLRLADRSIAVICGASKHAIARAVLVSGLCTVLVTDEDTAASLVNDTDGRPDPAAAPTQTTTAS